MEENKLHDATIVICGATGYIGSHLVARLTRSGAAVKCLVRTESDTADVLAAAGAQIVQSDLSGSKPLMPSLVETISGASVMVNLVGSIAPKRGETLDSLHARHTAKLVNLCNACGIPKMVMVTALGSCENANSKYHASKWKAEQELINSGLAYVILQPSLVYGRQVGNRNSKLVKRFIELINDRPVVPLIGGGHNRLQPIFIDDLVQCIENSIASGEYNNRSFELGGADIVELKKFIELLMEALGQRKPFVDMPVSVARSIAAVCEFTQEVPLLSRDQIALTLSDNICAHNALQEVFHVKPTSLIDGIASYAPECLVNAL